ncbi:MAG: MmgE/PrpD family protein [Betaproteobacteria bacterium]|nr:MmgE/PrpD family protein [Betaproteobacteria bacterium]
MPTPAQILGKFAAELTFSDIPPAVVSRAKDSITDTLAVMLFGSQMPWSRMVAEYARRYGNGGLCSIVGSAGRRVHAPYAALANGVSANAFELDGARHPGVGAHPGATLLPVVLAACDETKSDCKTAITAFVAGCEVLFRIGLASHHSSEGLGFHAPGLTGPYGACISAGRVLGLDAKQMAHALGIAGSLSAGLLAFVNSRHGGMVKRLHLGRTSESGILAAQLAKAGFTGPETVLEGRFGYLEVYCRDGDASLLTAGLGERWETLSIGLKLYPYNVALRAAVQTVRDLMAEHEFLGSDVSSLKIECDENVISHHNILEPGDITQAQYSMPFCLALALFRDPDNPKSFDEGALTDSAILAACRAVTLVPVQRGHVAQSTRVTVRLKSGTQFARDGDSIRRVPDEQIWATQLRSKFMRLTETIGEAAATRLFERLQRLEMETEIPLL